MTRRIVSHMEMSLDGVVDHPERWAHDYFVPEMLEEATSQMPTTGAGTVLFGRRTYEEFARVWPGRPDTDPFARFLNSSRKVVVSRTIEELPWGPAERIDGTEAVAELKAKPGEDVLILGSPTLVGSLLQAGLLDTLEIFVIPIVIGQGQRLYQNDQHIPLRLVESRPFSNGVLLTRYTPDTSAERTRN
jgi:dihydrofolate reductase